MVATTKLIVPFLIGSALGYSEDLARHIARRVNKKGFADFVATRVLDTAGRTEDLAALAENINKNVLTPTIRFLSINSSPWNINSQIDGIALTIDSHKMSTCMRTFADNPKPCYDLVNALAAWSNAELCSRYFLGLDIIEAEEFGTCLEWLNP